MLEYRLLDLLENDLHSLDKSNKPTDFLLFFETIRHFHFIKDYTSY